MLPDLLGTYGDGGNAQVLAERARWRGIPARIIHATSEQSIPRACDIYLLGGGEDNAQEKACRALDRAGFASVIDAGMPVVAVCAGLQLLGRTFTDSGNRVNSGLGVLDVVTVPARRRAIGHVAVRANPALRLADPRLLGFENHRGRTVRGAGLGYLGRVESGTGNGDGTDGALAGNVIGTYLHGPMLALNPALADRVLELATGRPMPQVLDRIDEIPRMRRAALRRARRRRALSLRRVWRPAGSE